MPLCRELGIGFLAYRWTGHRVHACVIMHVLTTIRFPFVASLAPASWPARGLTVACMWGSAVEIGAWRPCVSGHCACQWDLYGRRCLVHVQGA